MLISLHLASYEAEANKPKPIAALDPSTLYVSGDKGILFEQSTATMYQTSALSGSQSVRGNTGTAGNVGSIVNQIASGGTITTDASNRIPKLVSGAIGFPRVSDAFTIYMGSAQVHTGSLVIATRHGTIFGDFVTPSTGVLTQLHKGETDTQLIGMFLINKQLTIEQKLGIKQWFIEKNANSLPPNLEDISRTCFLTKFDKECFSSYELQATSLHNAWIWQQGNMTTFPVMNLKNITDFSYAWANGALNAASINALLIDMLANRNGRTGVNCTGVFIGQTNAAYSTLSFEARLAVSTLKNTYSWDFTDAFNA